MKDNKRNTIILFVIIACAIIGYVDAILQPGYVIKSIIKIGMFVFFPFCYSVLNKNYKIKDVLLLKAKKLKIAIAVGIGIYCIVVGAYLLFKDVFDFAKRCYGKSINKQKLWP